MTTGLIIGGVVLTLVGIELDTISDSSLAVMSGIGVALSVAGIGFGIIRPIGYTNKTNDNLRRALLYTDF